MEKLAVLIGRGNDMSRWKSSWTKRKKDGQGGLNVAEYIDTSVTPADYIEVWEAEDAEHGKQIVMAVDDLKCLPPADVRPVVRGKWKIVTGERHTRWRECSVCGAAHDLAYKWPFCPSCGADMREA